MTVRTPKAVSESKVLAVIHGEVEMVQRMMRRSVDDIFQGMTGDHIGIVDEDAPEIDKDEETEIYNAMQRD